MQIELYCQILEVVAQIPDGKVATYGQVAKMAGLPRHARLVGKVLQNLESGSQIPWHRVINAQGKISLSQLDAKGNNIQALKLQQEGIMVIAGRVKLSQYQWQI
ncbi:MGMT family protein [Acinetobacter sp. ME22]|uniref:MGMT family protein n=1 Tax=Acinetobacter sp. ME22 TaxID=2904802 RepID=UPI001EDADA95|nr:MGMT family protein [Acinetobacter sp. ME22]MCG2573042.1 MGMT family protein [Acinetobacter sp. ME22]